MVLWFVVYPDLSRGCGIGIDVSGGPAAHRQSARLHNDVTVVSAAERALLDHCNAQKGRLSGQRVLGTVYVAYLAS